MFQTDNCSASAGHFCTCSIRYFTMHLWVSNRSPISDHNCPVPITLCQRL